ncbi:hypothetical protein LWM68_04635 [Niabella sp. W65]|nr:hypothetical protein [Niabella sp. W65]MCH7362118.1 hypothetical protein [Niabella sp. W65]ULT45869.1 hypothetical protein KRR40_23235 [Niabella sp. I65]
MNAGKPDLDKILKNPYNKRGFKTERKAFRKNQLVAKRILISTQRMTKD